MTANDLQMEINRGGRFVLYQYCISVIVLTFKRPSDIYFVRGSQSRVGRGMPYALLSLFFGWWGIPWGPIYTIQSLVTNFGGGKDLTNEVLMSFSQPSAPAARTS